MISNKGDFCVVDHETMTKMASQAAASERKRVHLLLHAGHDDQVQRLMIVMQCGTYVRPHYHPEQWEMLTLLRGRGELLRFSADGHIIGRCEMSPQAPVAQIPAGAWHSFVVIEPGTAIMEVKPGPYRPSEFAEWAPPEGDARVPEFLHRIAAKIRHLHAA